MKYPFFNEPLPYDYSALEPYIDKTTMEVHHVRLLQSYVDKLNDIVKKQPFLQNFSLVQLLCNIYRMPEKLQTPIQNYAGGVFNHRIFFDGMTPDSDEKPQGALAKAIDRQFGNFDNFKKEFIDAAMSVFGSGYAWLVVSENKQLDIITTKNQDTPFLFLACPVMTIDVWEHAYFLKHYNDRLKYIEDWFHVIDWKKADRNYNSCKKAQIPYCVEFSKFLDQFR